MADVHKCNGVGVYIPTDGTCDDCDAIIDGLRNLEAEVDVLETELDNKVDKVSGKGLSANDYTTGEKNKLAGVEAGAQKNRIYTAFTGKPTANQAPGFGESFTIQQIKQNTAGQVSASDRMVTIPSTEATASAAGLMSAADKEKLNGIASGAQPNRTYAAAIGKPTANQAPGFGDTVIVSQVQQEASGQVSVTDRAIKIPDDTASALRAGLMSAADKEKLDGLIARVAAIEALLGNKVNTVLTMTDTNNNAASITVLAE